MDQGSTPSDDDCGRAPTFHLSTSQSWLLILVRLLQPHVGQTKASKPREPERTPTQPPASGGQQGLCPSEPANFQNRTTNLAQGAGGGQGFALKEGGTPLPSQHLSYNSSQRHAPDPNITPNRFSTSDRSPTDFTVRPNRFVTALSLPPRGPSPSSKSLGGGGVVGGRHRRRWGARGMALCLHRCRPEGTWHVWRRMVQ